MVKPIHSMNPDFSGLLDLKHEDSVPGRRWPFYSTADDILPSHDQLKAERLAAEDPDATLVVEASDLLLPGEQPARPEKWPHPKATPTLALDQVFRLS